MTTGYLLRGGTVIDGTGAPALTADLRVHGERIVEIGPSLAPGGETLLELEGRVLAPGFIDVHTHDDRIALAAPAMLPKLSQGVTTVVVGNCGISLAPLVTAAAPPPLTLLGGPAAFEFPTLRDYARAVERARPAVNVAALVGHSTLRVATMADPYGPASSAEREAMAALLREALAAGAIGFSTGLFYPTNAAADIDEVVYLARLVAEAGGVYTTHLRDEFDKIMAALDESFTTAARANIPLILSHHKCAGHANWGRTRQTLARIDQAARSQSVALDVYPYTAGSTVLRSDLIDGITEIRVTWSDPHPELCGRALAEIAAEWGCSQKQAAERLQPAGAVYFQMHEDDVRRVLAHPRAMIGSDGLPHDRHPHPRLWGTFPRVLGHYSRDLGLFPLVEAVRRMTGFPAEQFRLFERGVLRAGAYADLVVFDPATVRDHATYEHPERPSEGIEWVFVNGVPSFHAGSATGERRGRFLRRSARDALR